MLIGNQNKYKCDFWLDYLTSHAEVFVSIGQIPVFPFTFSQNKFEPACGARKREIIFISFLGES